MSEGRRGRRLARKENEEVEVAVYERRERKRI